MLLTVKLGSGRFQPPFVRLPCFANQGWYRLLAINPAATSCLVSRIRPSVDPGKKTLGISSSVCTPPSFSTPLCNQHCAQHQFPLRCRGALLRSSMVSTLADGLGFLAVAILAMHGTLPNSCPSQQSSLSRPGPFITLQP